MPVNKALRFFDIEDFKSGEFTDATSGSRLLMPNKAAQSLIDGYPMPEGGLRAFFAPATISVSGLAAPTLEVCTGLFSVSGYSRRDGTSLQYGTVRYMTTWNETDGKARLYRMDGTAGASTWTVLLTTAGTADNPADRRYTSFARFETTAGLDYVIMILRSGPAAERGLYTIKYVAGAGSPAGDGTVTRINGHTGAMAIAQSRIIVTGDGNAVGGADTLYYTGPGAVDFSGAGSGNTTPQPNKNLRNIKLIAEADPSEIVLGFAGAPWVVISGDINSSSSPQRTMGDGHFPGNAAPQEALHSPIGLTFVEDEGFLYATDGRAFTDITPGLAYFNDSWGATFSALDIATAGFQGTGNMAFADGFLFAPGNYVMFEESQGWFETSEHTIGMKFGSKAEGVLSASRGVSFTLKKRLVSRGKGTRNSQYCWRSAPFADPDGRQSEIREVQVFVQAYTASTITVLITDHVGGTVTKTSASIAAGKSVVALPMLKRGKMLDVKVTATATNSTSEAPTIERVRVGFGHGHQL